MNKKIVSRLLILLVISVSILTVWRISYRFKVHNRTTNIQEQYKICAPVYKSTLELAKGFVIGNQDNMDLVAKLLDKISDNSANIDDNIELQNEIVVDFYNAIQPSIKAVFSDNKELENGFNNCRMKFLKMSESYQVK